MKKEGLSYLSEKEMNSQNKFKNLRDKTLLPISKILMKLGLTANIISYIGLFLLVGFVYYARLNPILATIFLALHVLLDAFDGPLARLMKEEGDSGTFTDMFCDHSGMVIVVITLIWVELLDPLLASIYIYIYTILIIFIVLRSKMKVPIKLAIRSKYLLYILYLVYAIWDIDYLNLGLIIFNIAMIPSLLTSYFIIKRELK